MSCAAKEGLKDLSYLYLNADDFSVPSMCKCFLQLRHRVT